MTGTQAQQNEVCREGLGQGQEPLDPFHLGGRKSKARGAPPYSHHTGSPQPLGLIGQVSLADLGGVIIWWVLTVGQGPGVWHTRVPAQSGR